MITELVLASASPRRKDLLEQIGVHCRVCPTDVCENVQAGEHPHDYTRRLALEKARHCRRINSADVVVLAADTTVFYREAILGKPESEMDAVSMLMALSNQSHQVVTGVAVISAMGEDVLSVTTHVQFAQLTEEMCRAYWQTGEPKDKAGSYAIQGLGAVFVQQINGSYSNVVGLPLFDTAQLLKRHGIHIWNTPRIEKERPSG